MKKNNSAKRVSGIASAQGQGGPRGLRALWGGGSAAFQLCLTSKKKPNRISAKHGPAPTARSLPSPGSNSRCDAQSFPF